MKYIRTKNGRIVDITRKDYITNGNDLILHKQFETVSEPKVDFESPYVPAVVLVEKHNEYIFIGVIEKQADTIEKLFMTGDLLIVEDTTKTYLHSTFPVIYNEKVPFDCNSPIYRIKEFYIKNNGNFIKVAKIKNKGELELL